jgi:hypothetical protein
LSDALNFMVKAIRFGTLLVPTAFAVAASSSAVASTPECPDLVPNGAVIYAATGEVRYGGILYTPTNSCTGELSPVNYDDSPSGASATGTVVTPEGVHPDTTCWGQNTSCNPDGGPYCCNTDPAWHFLCGNPNGETTDAGLECCGTAGATCTSSSDC